MSQPVPRHRGIKEPLTKHIIKVLSDDDAQRIRLDRGSHDLTLFVIVKDSYIIDIH